MSSERPPGTDSGLGSYVRLLRGSGAAALAFSSAIGRLPVAMWSIVCLMLVSAATGSIGEGGAVAASLLVAQGVAGPVLGRLADLRGQRRVLLVAVAVHATGMALLVAAIECRAALWIMMAAAALAGSAAVSFDSFMRARWTAFVDASALRTAFALESMLDETSYLLGPIVATALVSTSHPIAGLVVCALLTTCGSLAVAAHRASEPGRDRDPASPSAELVPRRRALAIPGVRVLMLAYAGMGFLLGSVDVTMISFAREHAVPDLTGVLLALTAVGSVVGGLAFGAVGWHAPQARLFVACAGLLAAGVVPLAVAPNVVVMGVLAILAGTAIAPAAIAGSTLLESVTPTDFLSEGFSLINGAGALGMASGTAVGAIAVGHGGFARADISALCGGLLAFTASVAGYAALRQSKTATAIPEPSPPVRHPLTSGDHP